MLGPAPTLRAAAIGCRLQPSLITSCAYTTYTTYSTYPTNSSSSLRPKEACSTPRRRVPLARRSVSFNTNSPIVRQASTAASPSSSRTVEAQPPAHLDWNTFFRLRKTRRWYQLGSSLTTSAAGFVGGAEVLSRSDMDALVSQIPLDPFITLGLITFACGGAGWLIGPTIGSLAFNWRNRKFRVQMDEKEKEFYRRIKRFRVDPSNSSMANPVPDYYGEKISSVAGYRQWLKDCRAFNKKRTTYIKA